MPDREIEIRPPTRDDLPAIGELYFAVKGRHRPESVDRWRLFDTPWGDSVSLIALDGDVCVALGIVWPAMLRVGGEPVLGGQGIDAVTHPDYRNRPRLFLSLARQVRPALGPRGIGIYFTFPNRRSIKILRVVGGTYLGEVGAWGVPITRRRALVARVPGWAKGLVVQDGSRALPEIGDLVASTYGGADVIGVDKGPEWLEWRYSQASCESYQWLALEEGGRLTAAALVGERDPEAWGSDFAGLARVHELFAADDRSAARLLSALVAHAARQGAIKVDILVKDALIERGAAQAGFVKESERPMTALTIQDGLPLDPYDFAHWRVISGDMDFF